MIKCYEKYKQTKNIWYPEVPSHWLLSKVKYVAKTIAGGTPSTDKSEYWDKGDIPWLPSGKLQNCDITTAEKFITEEGLNNSSTKWIKSDTTLIALTGATCANIGFLRFQACANQSVVAIDEFPDKANSRFLFYMLISMRKQILTHQSGGAQAGINDGNVKNLFLVVPPLNEQLKIAQYLDHQTVIIDQLIQQKEKLIELLKEKRQSVINEAVTKGFNPNAKMKDSGIEWLGEVPEGWNIIKLKFIIDQLQSGVSVNSENIPIEIDSSESGVLKTSCVFNYSFIPEENKKVVQEEYDRVQCPVRGNSIIISRMNTPELVGASGYVDRDYPNLFLPDRLWQTVFKDDVELDVEFLSFVLKSEVYRNIYGIIATGTSPSMKNISQSSFLDLPIPFPEIKTQKKIKTYLREFDTKASNAINALEVSIGKLKEYRQSIISEAVTGKIDVREWQPNKKQVA